MLKLHSRILTFDKFIHRKPFKCAGKIKCVNREEEEEETFFLFSTEAHGIDENKSSACDSFPYKNKIKKNCERACVKNQRAFQKEH
jgi:hypothetical protein